MKLSHLYSISFGILALSAMAPATLLTFEKSVDGGLTQLNDADLATYGDNVTGSGPDANGFVYGTDYGSTPDVLVD